MEVTYLPEKEPTAERRMENVMRELERWQKAKTKRKHLSIEDRAFVFRIKRMTDER